MEVIRQARLAKAQGLGLLAVIGAVAFTVHFWPRPAPRTVSPAGVTVVAPARAATERPPLRRPAVTRPSRVVQARRVRALLPAPPATPHIAIMDALESLPGWQMPVPDAPVSFSPNGSGAVTRAMRTTGRSVAGAFKKTGAAFRRAF